MPLNYKKLGECIRLVDERNSAGRVSQLVGLSVDKCYIPSVANVIGTDLKNYKIIRRGQFSCSLMQVSRDQRIPIALYASESPAIMSPAYDIFEISQQEELLPEYMELWFKRAEFDREATFYAIGGVRGSLGWEDFCNMKFPVPPIEEQRKIVHDYQVITDRIALLRKINEKLESVCNILFDELSDKAYKRGLSHLGNFIKFGNGKSRPSTMGAIPVYGGNGVLSYTDKSNAENVVIIGRVGAYCGSVFIEQKPCWISDNAIVAKSLVSENEFFDYCLLKKLNLYNHHVGTGQQLLTQGILKAISCPDYATEEICNFNKKTELLFNSIKHHDQEINSLKNISALLLANLSSAESWNVCF